MDTDTMCIFLEGQGFSDESIDDFLEHFGVRGQKWGVRKTTTSSGNSSQNREKFKKAAKIAGGVAGVAAVAAGAIYANKLLRHGDIPYSKVDGMRIRYNHPNTKSSTKPFSNSPDVVKKTFDILKEHRETKLIKLAEDNYFKPSSKKAQDYFDSIKAVV